MSTITNPITGKSVTVRIAKMNNGIAGRTRDSTPDNMTVYIDPLVPPGMYETLVAHEYCELKHLLKGDKWESAHRAATDTEHKYVTKAGADWSAYNRNYLKILKKVKSRGNTIKNPQDLFNGAGGERPNSGPAAKGADIADVVPLAPLGGQKPPKKTKPQVVGDCRTSDGKRTNCGNMPALEKEITPPDKSGRCHDTNNNNSWAKCESGGGSDKKPDTKPGSNQEEGKKPSSSSETTPDEQTPTQPAATDPRAPKGKWEPKKKPKREGDKEKLPTPEPGQMKNARLIPGFSRDADANTIKNMGIFVAPKGTPIHKLSQRSALKDLVGYEVDIEYQVDEHVNEQHPKPHFPNPSDCLHDTIIKGPNGEDIKIPHMWVQHSPTNLNHAPLNKRQRATARIGEYFKDDVDAKGRKIQAKDFNIKVFSNFYDVATGKPVPVIPKQKKSMDTEKATDPDKNGRCHDEHTGALASCGGGGNENTANATANDFDENDVPTPEKEPDAPREKLSSSESKAISNYQGADFAFINTWMRNPNTGGNAQDKEHYLGLAKELENAINKQPPLKGEEIVYRGIRADKNMAKNLVVGAVIEDPAFMSTTNDRMIAKNFGNTIFTIRVPKGTKALRMTDVIDTTSTRAENEMLLQRGTKIKITHVRQERGGILGMGSKTYIEARVV